MFRRNDATNEDHTEHAKQKHAHAEAGETSGALAHTRHKERQDVLIHRLLTFRRFKTEDTNKSILTGQRDNVTSRHEDVIRVYTLVAARFRG